MAENKVVIHHVLARMIAKQKESDQLRALALEQVDNLRSYPQIRRHLALGLQIHSWFYLSASGAILCHTPESGWNPLAPTDLATTSI